MLHKLRCYQHFSAHMQDNLPSIVKTLVMCLLCYVSGTSVRLCLYSFCFVSAVIWSKIPSDTDRLCGKVYFDYTAHRPYLRFKNVKGGLCNLRQKIASVLFSKYRTIRDQVVFQQVSLKGRRQKDVKSNNKL